MYLDMKEMETLAMWVCEQHKCKHLTKSLFGVFRGGGEGGDLDIQDEVQRWLGTRPSAQCPGLVGQFPLLRPPQRSLQMEPLTNFFLPN